MYLGVNHIGIAVKDLDEALKVYVDGLGTKKEDIIKMPEQGMAVAMLGIGGNSKIELLAPIGAEGVIAKFIESRGEGIHHICLEVDDIEAALKDLAAKGVRLIDTRPRQGVEGKIAFIHPKTTNGALVELVETPKEKK